jgi:hypothetical protein
LIEVIRSSGEEMWRVDAYQMPYYSRDIEGEKQTHRGLPIGQGRCWRGMTKVRNRPKLRRVITCRDTG